MLQRVQTMRGANDGTGTASGRGSVLNTPAWWHSRHSTAIERTPFSRMLPRVMGVFGAGDRGNSGHPEGWEISTIALTLQGTLSHRLGEKPSNFNAEARTLAPQIARHVRDEVGIGAVHLGQELVRSSIVVSGGT